MKSRGNDAEIPKPSTDWKQEKRHCAMHSATTTIGYSKNTKRLIPGIY